MPIEKVATDIPGCFELRPTVVSDVRGTFVKTYEKDLFEQAGLQSNWVEQYYSVSRQRVLRGLHFQLPPHDHAKMVYVTEGEVLDVVVDLRRGSPSFRQHVSVVLGARRGNMIYLARGLAHGFYTMSRKATLVYNVSSAHEPAHDAGIRWDSANIVWPDGSPIISERDRDLPALHAFDSPFQFDSRW